MPTIGRRNSLTTGTAVDNVLVASQYEFAPFDGTIEIGIISSVNLVTCAVFSGPDVLAEPSTPVNVRTTEQVLYPDDYTFEDEVAQGDRLKISLLNSNAGTAVVNTVLRITPA